MDNVLPGRAYTRADLLPYLQHGRAKSRAQIASASDLLALPQVRTDWDDRTIAALLLYNMRHVQEHAAQLSMCLGNQNIRTAGWVGRDTGALADEGDDTT